VRGAGHRQLFQAVARGRHMVRARVAPSGLQTAGQAWGDGGFSPSGGSTATPERGCLPGTNCCAVVPQDQWYAVERFGKFQSILRPGLNFAGCDCCGVCLGYRSISSRIAQSVCTVVTKTKDNVFVTVKVAVQRSVLPDSVELAMYRLSDVDWQIDSYVSDVVRCQVPLMLLDEAFVSREDLASAVEQRLQKEMASYGYKVHKALVIELTPDNEVVESMNEINKQRRLRDAKMLEAEAEKIRVVKAAEANADKLHLEGEGTARQRRAIVKGLHDSITEGTDEILEIETIKQMLLVTQYFETMRGIAQDTGEQAVFLPHSAGEASSVAAQIRRSVSQAAAAPGQVRM